MKISECKIKVNSIEKVIEQCMLLDTDQINILKKNAKSSFQYNSKEFTNKISIILKFIYNDVT